MADLNDHSSRSHGRCGPSSSNRWLNCPPSAMAAEAYPNEETSYTREGTMAHEVAEAFARADTTHNTDGIYNLPEEVTAEMIDCAKGYSDYIQEQIKSDDATVLLEQRVDFSPWVPQGFGTADCVIVQGKTITVIDYKFGQGVAVDAKENTQMMLYALGALNLLGDLFDLETVEMHIYQPRINNISSWSASAADLLYWAEKTVKRIADLAYEGKGKYKAGAWCKFCPHAGKCRQLTKTCTEYVEIHGMKAAIPVLAPHEVAEVLQMQPLVELWLKRVKDQALTTLLDGGVIPGYKVVEGRGSRSWRDEERVANILDEADYDPKVYTKTELLSPAAMEKAIGKKAAAELLADQIEKRAGAPTIAPNTDKRPAYDRTAEAIKDFE